MLDQDILSPTKQERDSMLSILKCFFWKKKQLLKIPTFQEIIRLQELQFKQPTLLTPFYAKEFIEFGVYG